METTFSKRDEKASGSLLGEAAALEWLGGAERLGGLRTACVLHVDEGELVEERIRTRTPTRAQAKAMGRALAHTHAAGAPWFGCPPPGWEGSYVIAHTKTPTVHRAQASTSWGAFFARWRILCYLSLLRDTHILEPSEISLIERVASRLDRGDYDAPQPALVEVAIAAEQPCIADVRGPVMCARIHGDLWAGNLLADCDEDNHAGGVLIDPMAHGGHAETDLAMLQLFGYPHLDDVLVAYCEESPLADGWRERVGIHQLAPLLHHCALFGTPYVEQTLATARRYA